MNLVNLTPHAIVLKFQEGESVSIPPSGKVARVASTPGILDTVEGIPVPVASPATYGEIVGLPDPEPHTLYIVSALVGGAMRNSNHSWLPLVLCPGTGPNEDPVRDAGGKILAVTRLVRP